MRRACTKSYVTSEPYPRASQIWCQNVQENSKEKSHKVSPRELCALQSNRVKCRGGALKAPPPSLFRVKDKLSGFQYFTCKILQNLKDLL